MKTMKISYVELYISIKHYGKLKFWYLKNNEKYKNIEHCTSKYGTIKLNGKLIFWDLKQWKQWKSAI